MKESLHLLSSYSGLGCNF